MSKTDGMTQREPSHRAAIRELGDFKVVATALGVDPDAASRRAAELGDERRDLDNAEVFLIVLREIVDGGRPS